MAGLIWAVVRFAESRRIAWIVARGRELIAVDAPYSTQLSGVKRWIAQTQAAWPAESTLASALCALQPDQDLAIRRMVEAVAGVNFGDRKADWQRWHETAERLRTGDSPKREAGEYVRLRALWDAKPAVGLTGWYSNILVLDRQIFVPSLGRAFGDPHDPDDGVVMIDGGTGAARLLPTPRTDCVAPPDVIGISAGTECIFVSCRGGFVYSLSASGAPGWLAATLAPPGGAPLTVDINGDEALDAVVPLENGRVVALSGADGKTLWEAPPADTRSAGFGFILALDAERRIWQTAPDGAVRVLERRNGRVLHSDRIELGTVAGPLLSELDAYRKGWIANWRGVVWSLDENRGRRTLRALDALIEPQFALDQYAALRTVRHGEFGAPLLIAAAARAETDFGPSTLAAWSPHGIYWRVPTTGAIRAAPAIADVNRATGAEILTATRLARGDGAPTGELRIYSSAGQLLHAIDLGAPVECPIVVADVNGDYRNEILIADEAGTLHCFETRRGGVIEWGSLGGDAHNTRTMENAFSFGQTPAGRQWHWRPEASTSGGERRRG